MKKRHTDEQIIRVLREAERREEPVKDLCKRRNITEQTFYRWRNKFGGMDVAEARRLKELESENDRLKRLIAEQLLVIDGLKEFSRKQRAPRRAGAKHWKSRLGGVYHNARHIVTWDSVAGCRPTRSSSRRKTSCWAIS